MTVFSISTGAKSSVSTFASGETSSVRPSRDAHASSSRSSQSTRSTQVSPLSEERYKVQLTASKELRDYGVGAQILLDLGVRNMTLLSNHKKTIVGLEGYGLTVEGQQAIPLDIS